MGWIIGIGIVIWIIYSVISDSSNKSNVEKPYYSPQPTYKPPKLNVKQVDLSSIILSSQQEKLLNKIESSNSNIFITGKAGTGKSILLQYFKQKTQKKVVVVAPTGVAALNIGGQTIHSLFRIPPEFITKEKLSLNYKTALLLKNIDTVVIDEISMVRADLMDAIAYLLEEAKNNGLPFGGVQIVMFGDLYQLPPVVHDKELHKYFAHNHGGYYFFNAHCWKNTLPEIYELTQIFRQKDNDFKEILNKIRTGDSGREILEKLNQRVTEDIPEEGSVTLVPTNSLATSINHRKLEQLNGKIYIYNAVITGNLETSAFPTEQELELKVGAQVMFVKNDRDKKWVNGTIGKINSLSDNEIKVDIDGIKYSVSQENWAKIRYQYNQDERKIEEEVVSSFTQFPLRLAWAMTVHKSQGQTYNSMVINMGDGAFAHGQTYVALSRCTTLNGLYLKREIMKSDIIVDPAVVNFMANAKVLELPVS